MIADIPEPITFWLDAQVQAHCVLPSATAPETCSELVYLTCGGESAQHMAGLVTPLLISRLDGLGAQEIAARSDLVGTILRRQGITFNVYSDGAGVEPELEDVPRSLGASNRRIIFREILPNLVAPILVYSTLLIPTNILFEAALSFLGVGVRPPTATWGGMLSDAVTFYTTPHFMLWPGLAIFATVLAFNLFGDGLRDALDPRTR